MPMPGGQPSNDHMLKPDPAIKAEPGLESSMMPQAHQQNGQGVVQERVTQQLQSMYGDRAAASITKLREQPMNGNQPANQQRPGQIMPQGYPQQYPGHPQQQYRPNMPPNPSGQQQRGAMPNGQRPPPSQMDGADDAESHVGVFLRRSPAGENVEMGRVQIDSLLHAQIAAKAKAMEGGGLMVPLRRSDKGKGKGVSYHRTPVADGPSQFDGLDDSVKDEAEDEDAINSDLDDPDDNIEDDDEDEDGGQIMLCMYDKVQRVKNKWYVSLYFETDGSLQVLIIKQEVCSQGWRP